MKATFAAAVLSLLAASEVAAHSTWQQLWVNGVDQASTCCRKPPSNSPVDVASTNMRCNAGTAAAAAVCSVNAGGTVTVEMHGHDSRACSEEAIGGQHYGPVMVYLGKVDNAKTADGSGAFFKIYEDGWASNPSGSRGDDDYWGNKDLNNCCGKLDVKIPTNIPSGDYLLRAETIALHNAGTAGGAQFYMSCYQITVTGGSGSVPAGVTFPSAYKGSDPGILVNIHTKLSGYTVPGPAVIAGGTTKVAGSSGCGVPGGSGQIFSSSTSTSPATTTSTKTTIAEVYTTTRSTTAPVVVTTTRSTTAAAQTTGGTAVAAYGQCGGISYTGSTNCVSGYKCAVINAYYSQCTPN